MVRTKTNPGGRGSSGPTGAAAVRFGVVGHLVESGVQGWSLLKSSHVCPRENFSIC